MTALSGDVGDMYVASLPSIALNNEACTDDGTHLNFAITNKTKRFLDRMVAVTVQVSADGGATWAAPGTAYTIQYCGGVVVFTTALGAGTLVRLASANYLPVSQLGQTKEWKADLSLNVLDVSTFGSGWNQKIGGLREGSGSASRYWLDGAMLAAVAAGNPLVFILYTNYAAGSRYEAYGWISKDSLDTAVDAAVTEVLSFDLDGQVFYYAS